LQDIVNKTGTQPIKTNEGDEVQLHLFLNSAQYWGMLSGTESGRINSS